VRPLLIGQGANDVRVKASESEQIVAAMQHHGIPVTYVYYPDEGHGFERQTAAPLPPLWKRSSQRISAGAASQLAMTSKTPRSSLRPVVS
jgi:dipeptidyl aminopeptidase/acylaminoacyl peptidase